MDQNCIHVIRPSPITHLGSSVQMVLGIPNCKMYLSKCKMYLFELQRRLEQSDLWEGRGWRGGARAWSPPPFGLAALWFNQPPTLSASTESIKRPPTNNSEKMVAK